MKKYREYTDQDIIENAKHVESMAGLLRSLDLKQVGGNYINMKRNLQRLNVDTNHWTGQAWTKEKQLKDYSDYTKNGQLRKHLIKLRNHTCENCNLTEWLGSPIPLELHHIDGERTNNNLTNLQILCSNCHALTDNWRNRKKL